METLSNHILINIASYLRADDLAHFSMVSKTTRNCTMKLETIDLTQIIYCYSKLRLLNTLKLLRFHRFNHWIIPTSDILNDKQLSIFITNWIHNKYNHKHQQTIECKDDNNNRIEFIQSITLKRHVIPEPAERDIHDHPERKLWSMCFKGLSLQNLKIEDPNISIPYSSLTQSFISLKSLEICPTSLSNMDGSYCAIQTLSKLFCNLETVVIRSLCPQRRNRILKYNYTHFESSQFDNLQILMFRTQRIELRLQYLLTILSTFPALKTCHIEYCIFRKRDASRKGTVNIQKNVLESLYFKGITVTQSDLNAIELCFGGNLKYLSFKHCKIPMINFDDDKTRKFAKQIVCDDLLNKIKIKKLRNGNRSVLVTYRINDELYKKNDDIIICNEWIASKEYEICKLCDCRVGKMEGLMDDHLNTICENALIECSLCLKKEIKRCEMTNHWNNECVGYQYSCSRCLDVIVGKDKFYQHRMQHEKHSHKDSDKGIYYFANDKNEYKDNYCIKQSIELGWICDKCQQRCFDDKNNHKHWGPVNNGTDQHLLMTKILMSADANYSTDIFYVSKLIVYGWMKRMEKKFKASYKIPVPIIDIICKYHTL